VLLAAKRANPDRVFLLLGNRDLNKVRLVNELAPPLPSVALDNIPPSVDSKHFPSARSFLLNMARSMVRLHRRRAHQLSVNFAPRQLTRAAGRGR
jgi:hypothetical protein